MMGSESSSILSGLTEPQRQAVQHVDGPLLVLAGPGSGKTRVVTHRIVNLIQHEVPADSILAITFTNKAASEMRDRVRALTPTRGTTLCTFHSLCARLLRQFSETADMKQNYTIYDQSDAISCVRDILKSMELDTVQWQPSRIHATISNAKNDLLTPEGFAAANDDFYGAMVAKVYPRYQQVLKDNNAVDFDDLLLKMAFLMRDRPDVREQLEQRYRYVLVDEYQDTNHAQYQIARGLTLTHANLFVTGDPDQSIYGWRGANLNNILEFERDFTNATVIRLEQNYRSTKMILAAADALIRNNKGRKEKGIWTDNEQGARIELAHCDDEHGEAENIAQTISNLTSGKVKYGQIAIFYRTNAMTRVIEEHLRRAGTPYRIARGVEFYNRKEIKDLLAYLKFLANLDDALSLERVINTPPRGIGNTSLNRLREYARRHDQSMWQAANHPDKVDGLGRGATSIKKFSQMIGDLIACLDQPVATIVDQVVTKSGYADAINKDAKAQDMRENVDELISSAAQFDQENPEGKLVDYLQQVALVSDADAVANEDGAVNLMTLHTAKGLEFPVVFLAGLEEDLLPHANSSNSRAELEEERRLLFVGMTRAMKVLHLSNARFRTLRGLTEARTMSRFIDELPTETLNIINHCGDDSDDDYVSESWDDEMEEDGGYPPGCYVEHPRYGVGRVATYSGSGSYRKVVVKFTTAGTRTLVLRYANLERIER